MVVNQIGVRRNTKRDVWGGVKEFSSLLLNDNVDLVEVERDESSDLRFSDHLKYLHILIHCRQAFRGFAGPRTS